MLLLGWMLCTISLWGFCCVFSRAGGEGGVLAAACSVIGVGSDIGGSIRMPAFFNGVFGHKPTTGTVGVGISSPPSRDAGMRSAGRGRNLFSTFQCLSPGGLP